MPAKPPPAPPSENWCSTDVKITKCSSTWTINNFSFCGEEMGKGLNSSVFLADTNNKLKWWLRIYPKGRNEETKNYVSVYLNLVSSNKADVRAKYKVSILGNKLEKRHTIDSQCLLRFTHVRNWGFPKFILQNVLLNKANQFIFEDKLTLCCEISIVDDPINISGQNVLPRFKIPECSLQNNMEQLFERPRHGDFILSVNGQEFIVHKDILASRSPVFAAMFEHDMEEKKHNRVEITDMKADVMKEMLRFVYTGKVPCLKEMAEDLLAAADKYSLDRLKVLSEEALSHNLSVDTASNLLALADMHSADQLKSRAIEFITLHAAKVMATSSWKTMVMQHPHSLTEAFRALSSQRTLLSEPPRKKARLN